MAEETLKTLKDIEVETITQVGNTPIKYNQLIDSYELKQEAIKHVKELEQQHPRHYNTIEWIIKFFNISEEELK